MSIFKLVLIHGLYIAEKHYSYARYGAFNATFITKFETFQAFSPTRCPKTF